MSPDPRAAKRPRALSEGTVVTVETLASDVGELEDPLDAFFDHSPALFCEEAWDAPPPRPPSPGWLGGGATRPPRPPRPPRRRPAPGPTAPSPRRGPSSGSARPSRARSRSARAPPVHTSYGAPLSKTLWQTFLPLDPAVPYDAPPGPSGRTQQK